MGSSVETDNEQWMPMIDEIVTCKFLLLPPLKEKSSLTVEVDECLFCILSNKSMYNLVLDMHNFEGYRFQFG